MLERVGGLSNSSKWLILLLFCAVFFFIWPSRVPLTEVDEARFAEASREMLESGNYMIPMFNYEPRYRKPIFIYWLQAAAGKPFGMTETAARFPSAVAMTATTLMLFMFLRKRVVPKVGGGDLKRLAHAEGAVLLGTLAFVTIPYSAFYARAAVTDAVLTAFITAAMLCLLEADLRHAEGNPRTAGLYMLAGLFSGLAVLTKGLPGLAVPFGVWLVYHWRQKDLWDAMKQVPWVRTVGVMVLVAAPWYVGTLYYPVTKGGGPGFLNWFIFHEHFGRIQTTQQGHGTGGRILNPLVYSLIAVLLTFPLSAYVANEMIRPFGGRKSIGEDETVRRIRRFAYCWLVVVIAIFSIPKTMMQEYILSTIGASLILFVLHVMGRLGGSKTDDVVRARRMRISETVLLAVFGVIWFGAVVFVLTNPSKIVGIVGETPYPQPLTNACVGMVALCALAFAAGLFWRRDERRIRWTLGSWAVFYALACLLIIPMVLQRIYSPTVEMGEFLRRVPGYIRVISYCKGSPEGLVFYGQRRVWFDEVGKTSETSEGDKKFRRDLDAAIAVSAGAVVLVDDAGMARLKRIPGLGLKRLTEIGHTQVVEVYTAGGPL